MICISKNLNRVTCNTAKKVDRVASAANDTVTNGVLSPVLLSALEHMRVVVLELYPGDILLSISNLTKDSSKKQKEVNPAIK